MPDALHAPAAAPRPLAQAVAAALLPLLLVNAHGASAPRRTMGGSVREPIRVFVGRLITDDPR